jgi:hypothetical protein
MPQEATAFPVTVTGRQRPPEGIGWLLLAPLLTWVVAFELAPDVIMLV